MYFCSGPCFPVNFDRDEEAAEREHSIPQRGGAAAPAREAETFPPIQGTRSMYPTNPEMKNYLFVLCVFICHTQNLNY